jgi:ATP-binding cassette, subfamily C, bacterial CydD
VGLENRLLRQDSRAGVLLFLAVGAGFIAAAMLATQAWLLSAVVERVFIQNEVLIEVLPWLVGMLVIISIRSVALWSEVILAQRSASRIKHSLRQQISTYLFRAGPAFTQLERSGELASVAVDGVETLDSYLTQFLPARYLAFSVPVFIFILVLVLDPWTTLILLVTGPFLVLLLALIGGRSKAITERRFLELSWMSAFFLDILQGITTLKMFGRSREQAANIEEISKKFGATTMEVLRTAFQTSLVMEWAATAATAMVAVEVSLRLMQHSLSLERGLAVLLLTPEFFLPLRQMALRYHSGTAGKSAAERIFAILDTPVSTKPIKSQSEKIDLEIPEEAGIRFEGVSFAYQDGQRSALRDCSLEIPHGIITALVGPSGAGKTTISSLILRFIEPQAGKIRLAGIDLTEVEPAEWRSRIAWVPQHPRLFHGTIEENIRLANPRASKEEVIQSAQDAYAHDFIQSLPQGYQTPIGDLGASLSGGQAQRIAIARAYLKNVPYLIVDEATVNLDSDSEALILEALLRLFRGRTALVIAHRLPMAARADRILVLDQGKVVESGDHPTLMAGGRLYARMAVAYQGGNG